MPAWSRSTARAAVTLLTLACANPARAGSPSAAAPHSRSPIVVLISIDGFRWDYLDSLPLPNLHALAREGVRARWMVPAFPTQTFPNHYTIVTGLYPAHHGIVNNTFVDPADGARFRYTDSVTVGQSRWWGGEPVWVTAIRQGRRAASMYWVGSEAAIEGVRPTYWKRYDGDVPGAARVDTVLAWLALPDTLRPSLVTLYFQSVDHEAHDSGPLSPEMDRAADSVDQWIGRLRQGLERQGLADRTDIIVVSDHGQASLSPERQVFLDDYIDRGSVVDFNLGSFIALAPKGGSADSIAARLATAPHAHVYARANVPARWHYEGNPRIAPIVGVMDAGWTLTTRAHRPGRGETGGNHGYDSDDPLMRATFIAAGPAFRRGVVVPPFQNIHVYDLICHLLDLRPASNDGSLDSVRTTLR
jgi:predicted AlkP superfamily pyrophosphatase or phosphodiesterase